MDSGEKLIALLILISGGFNDRAARKFESQKFEY